MYVKHKIPGPIHFQYTKLLLFAHMEDRNSIILLKLYVCGVKYNLIFEMNEQLELKIVYHTQ